MLGSKKILFATDLSDNCQRSYNVAVNMAASCNWSFVLLHVMEPIQNPIEDRIRNLFGEERYEKIMDEYENDTRQILIGKRKEYQILQKALLKFCNEQTDAEYKHLKPDEIIIKQGDIVEEIISTAKENNSEIIILSRHDRNFHETSITKIIQDVILQSPIPIMIMPPID
jgi:nucleotide-binding universal stress UspA family protein